MPTGYPGLRQDYCESATNSDIGLGMGCAFGAAKESVLSFYCLKVEMAMYSQ